MSFRLKTILGVALIEAALLVLLVLTSMNLLRTSNEEELGKRAQTAATLFATTTKDAVLSTDLASLEAFVVETLTNPDLLYARVISESDGVLAEGGDGQLLNRPFAADASVDSVDDGVFDTAARVTVEGVVYGRVEIGMSIDRVAAVLAQARHKMVVIALVEMLLVALFSAILGYYLTRQLGLLNAAAQGIASGELGRQVLIRSHDEIGEVARSFNLMSENLARADADRSRYERQLRELNAELEARVERRTARLAEANAALEQTNAELKQTQAQLVHSEKLASIGQLSAGVAHEINNPIGFVKSNLGSLDHYTGQLLGLARLCRSLCESDDDEAAMRDALRAELERIELTYLEEDLREVLAESRDGIERVTNIVHDLDEFSRRDRAQWEHADLLRCIEATVRLAHSAVKAGVEVSLDFEPLPDIECMPSQLNQVFMNLIVNAAQAVGDQGRIVIRGRAHGDRVHLEFEDNGSGIESNIIGRIFDPFFTTRPVGSGSGLGLSIAHGIIEQHGGGIEVRSVPDQGTCFTVTLPIQRRPEACLSRQDVALAEHAA